MLKTALGATGILARSSIRPASSFKKNKSLEEYESLEEAPLAELRKRACHKIAENVLLPEYWKYYREVFSSDSSKLEGRFDVVVNSLTERLEKDFEAHEPQSAGDIVKSNGYRSLLSRPQYVAYPNISLPLSMTNEQPFGGKLRYNISDPKHVKEVRESFFYNFAFNDHFRQILTNPELAKCIKKMAQEDAIKDASPTNSPTSSAASQLQVVERQADRTT